ncbi:flavodoxin domain-containing protein [Cellulosimicrobium sp. 4261]|uniref:flavodoxin family protein n=1 Tax=Cellulosimicrobium sp. 4261 TaxID=3156458 RepID=UPI003399EEF8
MDMIVVYETHFGQTREVAEAVADGARQAGADAEAVELATADPDVVARAGLLVVGAPTHVRGMSRPWTRGRAHAQEVGTQGEIPEGVREWLATLPEVDGRPAAAFDTRLRSPAAGGAAHGMVRGLRRHGFTVIVDGEGFVVDGAEGPLGAGEADRARAWGRKLARTMTAPRRTEARP